jgi:hypothetical protein
MNETFLIPSDINQNKSIIPPIELNKSLSIAIYKGEGAGEEGVENVTNNIRITAGIEVAELTSEQVQHEDLSKFDVIIFSGGSGSKQAQSIGEKGRENVRNFIQNGGGYLGICAGAYLTTSGFDWSLHVVNAETISKTEWKRGKGFVDIELTDEGKTILGDVSGFFKCRYSSGPLLKPAGSNILPPFVIAAYFRSEVSENGVTEGVMINTPAAIYATYGNGKVFLISTHPENTPGLEHFIPRVLHWLTARDASI